MARSMKYSQAPITMHGIRLRRSRTGPGKTGLSHSRHRLFATYACMEFNVEQHTDIRFTNLKSMETMAAGTPQARLLPAVTAFLGK